MSQALLQHFEGPVTSSLHGTRLHYWPSPMQKPTATLFFISGNPGLSDYYIAFLTSLHRTVNSDSGSTSLEIFCPSQLGHDPLSSTQPASMISLDEQVKHKAKILETITTRWSGDHPRLILSGHSIGAWMSLEIVRRKLNKSPVYSVHLLFPTLYQMVKTPNARKLAWLLHASDRSNRQVSPVLFVPFFAILSILLSISLKVIGMLPLPIVHFLVLLGAPTQPPNVVRTTTNFVLTSSCVQQALSMANDEMRLVRQVEDLPRSTASESVLDVKLRAYWAAGDIDGWAPEKTRRVVEGVLGLQTYSLPQDILDKSGPIAPLQAKSPRKPQSFSIEEIRKARLSKRRALAGMVRAGASASYGLASSLGHLGYRSGQGHDVPSKGGESSGQRRPIKRRPSLIAARASRRFDGTIYIEPADGNESSDDLLLNGGDYADGVVFQGPKETTSTLGVNGVSKSTTLSMPNRASIVCRQGFKHAFVLEHSEQMANISAAMVLADMA